MNVSTFAGRIGGEPRLASVSGQQGPISVLNFSLAVDKRQKDQTTGRPLTLWVDCSLWGTRADALAQYIKKGGYVTVTGEADVELFQGSNGAGVKMTCRVSDLKLQGSAAAAPQANSPTAPQNNYNGQNGNGYQPLPTQSAKAAQPPIDFDEEVPF